VQHKLSQDSWLEGNSDTRMRKSKLIPKRDLNENVLVEHENKKLLNHIKTSIVIDGIRALRLDLRDPDLIPYEWVWTGTTRHHPNDPPHVRFPQIGLGSPARHLYIMLIGPVAANEQIRRKSDTNLYDVNPHHFVKRKLKDPLWYPYKDSDFIELIPVDTTIVPPEASFGEPGSPDYIADLVDTLDAEYAVNPFMTWDDYRNRFAEAFSGVIPKHQHEALEASGLLQRLQGEPKYVG
jgi:hypothetical protein